MAALLAVVGEGAPAAGWAAEGVSATDLAGEGVFASDLAIEGVFASGLGAREEIAATVLAELSSTALELVVVTSLDPTEAG